MFIYRIKQGVYVAEMFVYVMFNIIVQIIESDLCGWF